jgi:hypothetical protein
MSIDRRCFVSLAGMTSIFSLLPSAPWRLIPAHILSLFGHPNIVLSQTNKNRRPKHASNSRAPIFSFHSDEVWLNLHHFLYVLGRAENQTKVSSRTAFSKAMADQEQGLATLTAKERDSWREAVVWYAAGLSKKDLIFDDALTQFTTALARAGHAKSLKDADVDLESSQVLERVVPIYLKAWWHKHRVANKAWGRAMKSLVDRYGATVLAFISNAYRMEWPAAGYGVHICTYAGWAGAYSTKGLLLVVSSLRQENEGTDGLETVFHEGMHQWDHLVFEALHEQALRLNKEVPKALSHALIFFTAGAAIQRLFPEYVPSADKYGVWERGLTRERDAIKKIWQPYLDGRGTRDEAFAELIKQLVEPGKN